MEFPSKDSCKGREAPIVFVGSGLISAHETTFYLSPGDPWDGQMGAKQSVAEVALTEAGQGSCPGGTCTHGLEGMLTQGSFPEPSYFRYSSPVPVKPTLVFLSHSDSRGGLDLRSKFSNHVFNQKAHLSSSACTNY